MWISTFHSMCARLLRREAERIGYTSSFTIHDEDDRRRLIKRCLEELNLDPKRFAPEALARQISDAKSQLIGPEQFRERIGGFFAQATADVYALYEKRHAAMNAMDFDDLLMKAVQLLERYPGASGALPARLPLRARRRVPGHQPRPVPAGQSAGRAAPQSGVVGDDDQSIYSWRGADIRNILEFERDYPEAAVIRLEQNYRSTQCILDAAQRRRHLQSRAQGQEALDAARQGRARPDRRGGRRARRGPVRGQRGAEDAERRGRRRAALPAG